MSAWLFQCNPESFNLDGYLRSSGPWSWTVGQRHLARHMREGDRAFFWRAQRGSSRPSGVVAAGVLVGEPEESTLEVTAMAFWTQPMPARELRVPFRPDPEEPRKQRRVVRQTVVDDPVLSELRILRFANNTTYLLEPAHAERLEALWAHAGEAWSEEDVRTALRLYARADRRARLLDDALVSEVALQVGRPVSETRAKLRMFMSLDSLRPDRGGIAAGPLERAVWDGFFALPSGLLASHERPAQSGQSPLVPEPLEVAERGPERQQDGVEEAGHEPDAAMRRAIELHAMLRARAHYLAQGFTVEDTSSYAPFDLRCTGSGQEVRVEVKGTRGRSEHIEVTAAEVANARGTAWRTDLFVVHGIQVHGRDITPTTEGGDVRLIEGWRPHEDDLTPTRFRCRVPAGARP